MKLSFTSILLGLLLTVNIQSSGINSNIKNNVNFFYQQSENAYDFVSVIIRSDRLSNEEYAEQITDRVMNNIILDEYDISVKHDPFTIQFMCYTGKNTADRLLLDLTGAIVSGKSDSYFSKRLMPDSALNGEIYIGVKSGLEENRFHGIISEIRAGGMSGEYNLIEGSFSGSETFYQYDFPLHEDPVIPYIAILSADSGAYVKWTKGHFILSVNDSIERISVSDFTQMRKKSVMHIKTAKQDLEILFTQYQYIILSNNTNGINGIIRYMENMEYSRIAEFTENIRPSFIIREKIRENQYRDNTSKLQNGVTLHYIYHNRPVTEMSLMVSNIRKTEQAFFKEYSGALVMEYFSADIPDWKYWDVPPVSDFRIFSRKVNNEIALLSLKEIIEDMDSFTVTGFSREDLMKIINRDRRLRSILPFLENNVSTDALYHTEGEIEILKNRIFNRHNISVAVKTSIPKDSIVNILSSASGESEKPAFSQLKDERHSLGISVEHIENSRINELPSLIRAFFTYPSKVLILRDISVISSDLLMTAEKYDKDLYYNIANNYAITVMMLMSEYMNVDFSDMLDTYLPR